MAIQTAAPLTTLAITSTCAPLAAAMAVHSGPCSEKSALPEITEDSAALGAPAVCCETSTRHAAGLGAARRSARVGRRLPELRRVAGRVPDRYRAPCVARAYRRRTLRLVLAVAATARAGDRPASELSHVRRGGRAVRGGRRDGARQYAVQSVDVQERRARAVEPGRLQRRANRLAAGHARLSGGERSAAGRRGRAGRDAKGNTT